MSRMGTTRARSAPLRSRLSRDRRGGALLLVLWLALALSVIALAVASSVRSETERTTTSLEGLQAYYLATGAVERARLWVEWAGHRNPDGSPRYWDQRQRIVFGFPGGQALADIIPESSKMNVNTAPPEALYP